MQSNRIARRVTAFIVLATIATFPASAQSAHPAIATGIAIPTGPLGANRRAGPLLRAALTGRPGRVVRIRLELESAWMGGTDAPADFSAASGSLRVLGLVGSMLIGPAEPRIAPYLLLGGGPQRIVVRGRSNPYGTLVGLRAGAWLRGRAGRSELWMEVAPHVVLSDYGTGRDFALSTYWLVVAGVTFWAHAT